MAKLTLSVDDNVVSRAKQYAKSHGVSVSQMVETYLGAVTDPPKVRKTNTPILDSIRGILKNADIADYHKYLESKYR